MIELGFMSDGYDLAGLEDYLKECKIISINSTITRGN